MRKYAAYITYVCNLVSYFIADRRGQVAVLFGLSLIPIAGSVGAAVDYSRANLIKGQMQAALDSAVLAGALDRTAPATTATNVFTANFIPKFSDVTYGTPNFSVRGDGVFIGSVQVSVPTAFLGMLGINAVTISSASAAGPSAVAANGNALCLFSLNSTAQSVVNEIGGASLYAPKCIVQVNSNSNKAVTLSGSATLASGENCFVGGATTSGNATITPSPDAICQPKSDPFRNQAVPAVGACDYTNMQVNTTTTLQPGVYCGGLGISGGNVTFAPGLYIIKNGQLSSSGNGSVTGNGVSFYLTGSGAGVSTSGGTGWHIVASSTGTLKGFVFFLDPFAAAATKSTLTGQSEMYFEGVIYLPNQQLLVSGGSAAYTAAPFTAFIADTFSLGGTATVTILSDATKTSVPIPTAILSGSGGQKLHLMY
jgi:Flp pilus assembly protein TadG